MYLKSNTFNWFTRFSRVDRIVWRQDYSPDLFCTLFAKPFHFLVPLSVAPVTVCISVTSRRGNGGASTESDDPDDNILYLVKWRGLPYDQASWEYFKDIRFASGQILDFWDFSRPKPEVSCLDVVKCIVFTILQWNWKSWNIV